ncbi:cell wall-binding repeat-containing protein [uncultured Mobiluncus sp.]|uniref:cell wall-binding repeat-containing protein n=1 Tax=uncultured Mobiluncus sp. TaxID=293425 RepID=UPI0025FA41FA|nr:cell wall-binding repeat-containing protein [uncultured Mobiluncus sp.]
MTQNTYLKSWWPMVGLGLLGSLGLLSGPAQMSSLNPVAPAHTPAISSTAAAEVPAAGETSEFPELPDNFTSTAISEPSVATDSYPDSEFGDLMIGGGTAPSAAQAGWVAFISISNWDNTGSLCTGMLIDSSWVLTAGHCVANKPRYINISFGPTRQSTTAVNDYKANPQYDAVVMHLETPVYTIPPVTLASGPAKVGDVAVEYGWGGTSNALMSTSQRIVATCFTVVRGDKQGEFAANCNVPSAPGQFSYKTSWPGVKTEHGDSGGPLVVGNQVIGTLIGGNDQGAYFGSVIPLASWLKDITGVTLGAASGNAAEYPYESRLNRIAGADRVSTALALHAASGTSGDAIALTTGRLAPDALSSAALVGARGATVLLTVSNPVEPAVISAIKASQRKTLYVVGGGVKLSTAQRAELQQAGISITDLVGQDRFDTASRVAARAAQENVSVVANTKILDVFLVDAVSDPNIPDAIAAGPAVANTHGVILFTRSNSIPPTTRQAITNLANMAAQQGGKLRVWGVGGGAAAAAHAAKADPAWGAAVSEVKTIVGKDRFQTSTQLAQNFFPNAAGYLIASGTVFADGLAGSGYAHANNQAILLSRPASLDANLQSFVQAHSQASYTIAGGSGAVSRGVANQIGALLTAR